MIRTHEISKPKMSSGIKIRFSECRYIAATILMGKLMVIRCNVLLLVCIKKLNTQNKAESSKTVVNFRT